MFNKLIHRLLFLAPLFMLSTPQHVLAADKVVEPSQVAMDISEKVNINTATGEQFAAIKGIGEKKAQAIINYRQDKGDFVSVKQLLNVKGIGKGTLKKIEPFLTL